MYPLHDVHGSGSDAAVIDTPGFAPSLYDGSVTILSFVLPLSASVSLLSACSVTILSFVPIRST